MRQSNARQQTQFEDQKKVLVLYDHPEGERLAKRFAAHLNYLIPFGPRRAYWEFSWTSFDYVYFIFRKGDRQSKLKLDADRRDQLLLQKGQRRKRNLAKLYNFVYEEYNTWKQRPANQVTGTPRSWAITTVRQWTEQ